MGGYEKKKREEGGESEMNLAVGTLGYPSHLAIPCGVTDLKV